MQRLQKACGGLAGGIAVSYLLFVAQGQAQGTAYDPRFLQSEQHLQELIVPANEMAANRCAKSSLCLTKAPRTRHRPYKHSPSQALLVDWHALLDGSASAPCKAAH